ncbi:MAG: ThuA domain-containing protein [Cyclobacteriaceae bacterium]|nr:ThuA domain-containing protein [Cyclobacteriaceae bacterium]
MSNRREFLSTSLALGTVAAVLPLTTLAHNDSFNSLPLPSLKGRNILFTYGGWDGHEPEKFANYFISWLKDEGAEVQVFTTLDPYSDQILMDRIDLVIQIFTMSKISKEQEAGLLRAIGRNGTAMAGWHGGMGDSFRDNPDYQFMVGGQWVAHPGGVIDYDVKIVNHSDDVTKGLKDFKMKSEQYYMHIDPNVKVLATTKFTGAVKNDENSAWQPDYSFINGTVMPVAWKKMYGKGRVFYNSLGHNLDHVTSVSDAMEMMKRGIKWASASKYESTEKLVNPAY